MDGSTKAAQRIRERVHFVVLQNRDLFPFLPDEEITTIKTPAAYLGEDFLQACSIVFNRTVIVHKCVNILPQTTADPGPPQIDEPNVEQRIYLPGDLELERPQKGSDIHIAFFTHRRHFSLMLELHSALPPLPFELEVSDFSLPFDTSPNSHSETCSSRNSQNTPTEEDSTSLNQFEPISTIDPSHTMFPNDVSQNSQLPPTPVSESNSTNPPSLTPIEAPKSSLPLPRNSGRALPARRDRETDPNDDDDSDAADFEPESLKPIQKKRNRHRQPSFEFCKQNRIPQKMFFSHQENIQFNQLMDEAVKESESIAKQAHFVEEKWTVIDNVLRSKKTLKEKVKYWHKLKKANAAIAPALQPITVREMMAQSKNLNKPRRGPGRPRKDPQ